MNTALRPGVVPISVGSVDPAHVGGRAYLHGVGKRSVAQLDEHSEAIDLRYHQVVADVIV
jgi:hypothetical protein